MECLETRGDRDGGLYHIVLARTDCGYSPTMLAARCALDR